MIITVKNLQQQTFTINFDPEKTVLELKKQIFDERGSEYIIEKQKLIYAGVILTDERTINSYKVDEKKFIVVMLSRDIIGSFTPQQKPSTQAVDQQPLNVSATVVPTKPIEKAEEEKGEQSTSTDVSNVDNTDVAVSISSQRVYSSSDLAGELANATLQSRAESNLLMGEEYNRTVASMVEMGYARELVERAMSASFNNPERAVEYLINGIPDDEDVYGTNTNEEHTEAVEPQREGVSSAPVSSDAASDPFEFLRTQPQFLQMRSLIYQDPHLLHAVLQQIGQTNPALLQLISENQDAFLNMLNQPLEGERVNPAIRVPLNLPNTRRANDSNTATLAAETIAPTQAAPNAERAHPPQDVHFERATESGRAQPQSFSIRLSTHDQDAIERLKALGFPEALVLQAYFACEKDEQLAANFLLSSSFDD